MSSLAANGQDSAPLSMLAASLMENDPSPSPARVHVNREVHMHEHVHSGQHDHKHSEAGWGVWSFVFGFLLLALVFYFLYFALRPSFVLEQDCDSRSRSSASDDNDWRQISQGRLLGAAVLSAFGLLLVLWLFAWLARSAM